MVNPLTEMAYHALGARYGEDLSGLAAEEVAAALDSIAQDFLTVEGATYRDLLSFDPAADQGLLRVSWGVLQRQVVAAMNEGAGDAELARRVGLVWQRPKAAGVTATAEVVEKVAFVGARQVLTTARPDAWGSGVGVLHQAYIDDVSGALVDVRLTKALGTAVRFALAFSRGVIAYPSRASATFWTGCRLPRAGCGSLCRALSTLRRMGWVSCGLFWTRGCRRGCRIRSWCFR